MDYSNGRSRAIILLGGSSMVFMSESRILKRILPRLIARRQLSRCRLRGRSGLLLCRRRLNLSRLGSLPQRSSYLRRRCAKHRLSCLLAAIRDNRALFLLTAQRRLALHAYLEGKCRERD